MITRRIWLGACGAGILGAQAGVPETTAGKVFALWLAAFNSGDRGKLRAFLEKHSPDRLSRIEQLMDTREMSGGFELIRVEKSEPLALEAILREKESDTFAQLSMTIEPGDPAKIGKLGIRVVPPPEGLGPQRISQSEAIAALDNKAREEAAADRFSGALLIAKDGKALIEKAYGMADREQKKPNRVDTQFRMGSMNKMFTAIAALQLVAKGKMALEDPVGRFLPDYPNRAVAEKVQLRHLLSHTGGMGDIFTDEYDRKRLEVREPEDYVKLFGSRAPEFEPGTKWAYANYGMMLAGVLVAKA
ncbi:MAG: beta-lactamase family protein, partial [Bryobacter sp.]|nr:beta-lactamase family protein [Bryobacter sp.]